MDPVIVYADIPRTVTPVDFGDFGENGFKPLGCEKVLRDSGTNISTLWLRSKVLLRFGIMIFREKTAQKTIDDKIRLISEVYPIFNQRKNLGIVTYESKNFRGLHAVGDDSDISNFWAAVSKGDADVRNLNVHEKGVFWTGGVAGYVFLPYLDFDELGLANEFDRIWTTRIKPSIVLVHGVLKSRFQIFFNYRPSTQEGLWKYSFHVHFYELSVTNIQNFKQHLSLIEDMPKKSIWKKTPDGWKVELDPRKPIYDPAVYGGHKQLFRGPFCGKGGDVSAAMFPLTVTSFEGIHAFSEDKSETRAVFISRARISTYPSPEIKSFEDVAPSRAPSIVHVDRKEQSVQVTVDTTDSLWDFAGPLIINLLIPRWQDFRNMVMMSKVGVRGAVVPTSNLCITKNSVHETKRYIRHIRVKGDTFCMMDANSFHSRSVNPIGIVVDLIGCTVRQSCFACGTHSAKYPFLHGNDQIYIKSFEDSRFTASSCFLPLDMPHDFILAYYEPLFRLHRASQTVWVFDEIRRIWNCGSQANMIIGRLVDNLNSSYRRYLHCYQNHMIQKQLRDYNRSNPRNDNDPDQENKAEIFLDKLYKEARKFMEKKKCFCNLSAVVRGKIVDELKNFYVRQEVLDFNPYPHLVPMKNGLCLNIFNMDIVEIQSSHYFTTLLDAELTTSASDIDQVEEFMREVSSGDVEKRDYLTMIAGYMMTYMIHDRKFYVFRGSGKNAKGLFKEFLISILSGPVNCDQRWKSLNQCFWERRANANQSAENASPETYELSNKTMFYTDDIDRVPIDAVKVKRFVACEKVSGRALYGKPTTITPRGKVLWTTNHYPDLPGNDNAIWERYVQVDFLSKYVEKKEEVDPSLHRYQQNFARYLELLTKKDAFFTICMKQLNSYYRTLPFDPLTFEPTILSSFPVPKSMEDSKNLARSQQLPLASFIMSHTTTEVNPFAFVSIDDLFQNYMIFLENVNERKIRSDTTRTSFIRLLATALDIICAGGLVRGRALITHVVPSKKRPEFITADRDFADESSSRRMRH